MKTGVHYCLALSFAVFLNSCALPKFHRTKPETKPESAERRAGDKGSGTGVEKTDDLFLAEKGLSNYRKMRVPFKKGTRFVYPNVADLGKAPLQEKIGLRYQLDLNVPYGTKVVAAEGGRVMQVHEPKSRGGCDPSWEDSTHFIRIKHKDGTIAQYSHILSRVSIGKRVKKGQTIAVTNRDGFICVPQLTFGVFKSDTTLANSPQRETVPIYFEGLEEGILRPGQTYKVLR